MSLDDARKGVAVDSAGGGRRISPADTMSDVTQVPGKSPGILETHADVDDGVGPAGLCTLVRRLRYRLSFTTLRDNDL